MSSFRTRFVAAAGAVVLGAACVGAAPLRLALPPTPRPDWRRPETYLLCPLASYLREGLETAPGVRVLGKDRTAALLQLLRETCELEGQELLAALSAEAPVDALLDIAVESDQIRLTLLTAAGIRRTEIPLAADAAQARAPAHDRTITHAAAVADWLTDALSLDEASAAALKRAREEKEAFFTAYHQSRYIIGEWIVNTGEAKLGPLHPHAAKYAENPVYAARVLECAWSMTQDSRETDFGPSALTMSWMCLPAVLGTPLESSAHAILRERPERFEADLLKMAGPLAKDDFMQLLEPPEPPPALPFQEGAATRPPGFAYESPTPEQQRGAVRCLGAMRSAKALPFLVACAGSGMASTREAAATALGHYTGETGLDTLARLEHDPDRATAFAACHSLRRRGRNPERLLPLARERTRDGVKDARVVETLAALGETADAPLLDAFPDDPASPWRGPAAAGLLRIGGVPDERICKWLDDPDERFVLHVLAALPAGGGEAVHDRLHALANTPGGALARAARDAALRRRSATPQEEEAFLLAFEHPALRLRAVDAWAAADDPASLASLERAAANRNAHVRARAATGLYARDPARGRAALARASGDLHPWVRLHAAALLARTAGPAEAGILRTALAAERDPAIRLYLADGLARAENRPPPPPPPAANPMGGPQNITWHTGTGIDAPHSPARGYYLCGPQSADPAEKDRLAHAAGKRYIPRFNTVYNSGLLITDADWQDRFWVMLRGQMTTNVLRWSDGVVYGEESMSGDAGQLWESGWSLFCHDAGIDPDRVGGDIGALSPAEAAAWRHWAGVQVVQGFNILTDFTHLYFGKLRPGFQVGTYLPGQGVMTHEDKRWAFDFGGYYSYQGCTRLQYTNLRRFKTLWPDRPIQWLANGCIHIYGNLNKGTTPLYDAPFPTTIITDRGERPYCDNVSAWMAGADCGFFGGFAVALEKEKGIFGMHVESLFPGSPELERGIKRYAEVMENHLREKGEMARIKAETPAVPGTDLAAGSDVPLAAFDEPAAGEPPHRKAAAELTARTHRAFLIMGAFVYDCMRVFHDLPRTVSAPQALVVHPASWPGGQRFNAPGLRLLNAFDYLPDINQAAADLDFARYRYIAVSGLDKAPLNDRTIARLTDWLREQPGVLYLHGTLSPDNARHAATAQEHGVRLQRDWPWEDAVASDGTNYTVTAGTAQTLASDRTGATRVLWRGEGFAGAVLFDQGRNDAASLRLTLNRLASDPGIGLEMQGPEMVVTVRQGPFEGAMSTWGATNSYTLRGVDLLTGEANPKVGPGRGAALVADRFSGTYIASWNGVAILCSAPIAAVEPVENGLKVSCPGLIRAGAVSGRAAVRRTGGGELPAIGPEEAALDWVLRGTAEGTALLPIGDSGSQALYVRSRQPVVFTRD